MALIMAQSKPGLKSETYLRCGLNLRICAQGLQGTRSRRNGLLVNARLQLGLKLLGHCCLIPFWSYLLIDKVLISLLLILLQVHKRNSEELQILRLMG